MMKWTPIMLSLFLPVTAMPLKAQDKPLFVHEHFKFEVLSVEAVNKGIKITFLYTNLQESNQSAGIHNDEAGARNIVQNYLIDGLGYRYGYQSGEGVNHHHTYPSGIPVRISITFGDVKRSVSKFMFSIYWSYHSGDRWRHAVVFFKDLKTSAD